ncbi:DUF6445 family protein [Marinimicrobium sp. C2-29]|uniref:DUF6445 family protein n=1 Tax=Marinimicrobium sp. C2-29 TaxID=3139825 RepID=UPI003138A186
MADIEQQRLTRHPGFRVQVDYVGAERQPVVCIDSFLSDAEQLMEDAVARGRFSDNTGFYPGLRTPAPGSYFRALYELLPEIVEEVFGIGNHQIASAESSYSLVTTPPEALHPVQCIPHFDSNHPTELAMIHFLCGPEQGGTSFYRHRETGYEYVDEARRDRFIGALEAGTMPPKGYINGDTELFERIASYEAAFNRLLLYRCTSLHSGNIAEGFPFDTNPRTGRLSINTFLLNE